MGRLKERYNLRYYRFARDVTQVSDPLAEEEGVAIGAKPENAQTDLTGALEHVLDNTSPESLAGVLLLGDGRHNGAALPEDSLRQLAVRPDVFGLQTMLDQQFRHERGGPLHGLRL